MESMDLVRVNNTRPTILHLPDKVQVSSNSETGPRIAGLGTGKSLLPGGNNVEREEWERSKKNRAVAQWLKIGWLVEGGNTEEPEGPLAPLSLAQVGPTTAVAMAEGEDDRDVLMRWLKDEERPEVKEALKRKIEALGNPKKGVRK